MLAKPLKAGRRPLRSPSHPDVLCSDQIEGAEKGDAWGLVCNGMVIVDAVLSPEKMLKSGFRYIGVRPCL